MSDQTTFLRGKERIELPVTCDGKSSTLAAWKSHGEAGDCIAMGLVCDEGTYGIASIDISSILDSPSEVLVSALPGNQDVMGPHVLISFTPSTRHAAVDAMFYDERDIRKDIGVEGVVKMGPNWKDRPSPQDVGPDIDGFVKMLCSSLKACSEGESEWIDDFRIEVIHGKGHTYLAEGDRLIDVTGNSILYVCKQVVDLLIENSDTPMSRRTSRKAW